MLAGHPEIEDEAQRVLSLMRGATVSAIIMKDEPQLLTTLKLFQQLFCSHWVRENMSWSWRQRTTAASKLPNDWGQRGIDAAKRIAYFMQIYSVHPALVVNMDQTGVHLAPADAHVRERRQARGGHRP